MRVTKTPMRMMHDLTQESLEDLSAKADEHQRTCLEKPEYSQGPKLRERISLKSKNGPTISFRSRNVEILFAKASKTCVHWSLRLEVADSAKAQCSLELLTGLKTFSGGMTYFKANCAN